MGKIEDQARAKIDYALEIGTNREYINTMQELLEMIGMIAPSYESSLPIQQDKVAVPELQFPQSVVDWLGEPLEEEKDELMAYLMQYHWNEDSAYDDTLPIEVGEYLAESLSNVVKLLRAIEGESYTVEKEQLYYVAFGYDRFLVKSNAKFSDGTDFIWIETLEEIEQQGIELKHHFTEKEIKAIDKRYWAFAVPVEEDE